MRDENVLEVDRQGNEFDVFGMGHCASQFCIGDGTKKNRTA